MKTVHAKSLQARMLVVLTATVGWTLNSIPFRGGWFLDPCAAATLAFAVVLFFFWINLVLLRFRAVTELRVSAVMLCTMPVVYIAQYLITKRSPSMSGGWVWLELTGLGIFGGLAWLGLAVSPWFLVSGVLAHGILWDSWHLSSSPYMPGWYASGCFRIDAAFSAYLALRFAMQHQSPARIDCSTSGKVSFRSTI
jgi:hypothetical protein